MNYSFEKYEDGSEFHGALDVFFKKLDEANQGFGAPAPALEASASVPQTAPVSKAAKTELVSKAKTEPVSKAKTEPVAQAKAEVVAKAKAEPASVPKEAPVPNTESGAVPAPPANSVKHELDVLKEPPCHPRL